MVYASFQPPHDTYGSAGANVSSCGGTVDGTAGSFCSGSRISRRGLRVQSVMFLFLPRYALSVVYFEGGGVEEPCTLPCVRYAHSASAVLVAVVVDHGHILVAGLAGQRLEERGQAPVQLGERDGHGCLAAGGGGYLAQK